MSARKKKNEKKTPDDINPETGLSARQEEFARQYICPTPTDHYPKLVKEDVPFNGLRAAIRAGYAQSGAGVQATRLLKNAKIQMFMSKLQKPALDKFKITQERILQEMAALAFSNILDFINIDQQSGQAWIDITKCTREEAAALSAFEVIEMPPVKMVEHGDEVVREVLKTRIKMHDKKPILEMLARREKMLEPDRLEINLNQKLDETDRMEVAKAVAFMLRKAAEDKKKQVRTAKMGPAHAGVKTHPVD